MSDSTPYNKIYNSQDIRNYLEGKLSPQEMRAMELASLSDPFLADALEGFMLTGKSDPSAMDTLTSRLQHRVERGRGAEFIFPVWLRAAAIVSGVAITGIAIRYLTGPPDNPASPMIVQQQAEIATPGRDSAPVSKKEEKTDSGLVAYEWVPKEPKKKAPVSEPSRGSGIENERLKQELAAETLITDSTLSIPAGEPDAVAERKAALHSVATQKTDISNASSLSKVIRGVVTDENRHPVPGAIVHASREKKAVVTDDAGQFEIHSGDSLLQVEVSSLGYQTASLVLRDDSSPNTIMLRPTEATLGEVVVAGYGKKKSPYLSGKAAGSPVAEPAISWEAYNEYIRGSIKAAEDTSEMNPEVVVSFLVNKKGGLSQFAIEKPSSDSLNEEAIRLIRQGPGWKVRNGRSARAKVTVKFRK